jgi:predicted amidohydrolase
MDRKKISEIKQNLIKSEDIYTLIANLYCLCATEFTTIHALIQKDNYRGSFLNYFHTYKQRLMQIGHDIFTADFLKIIAILKTVNSSRQQGFLVSIWAYLRAIDIMVSDDAIYLNTRISEKCNASDFFGGKKYLLLFKPKNLIFETIKKRPPEKKIKSGFDVGLRIDDQLQKLILYQEHHTWKIDIKRIDSYVDELLLAQGTNLAFAVAPIYYDFEYSFKRFKSYEGVPYIFAEIKNRGKIKEIITHILNRCLEEKVHILVLPELTIDEKLRGHISTWLRQNNTEKTIIMVVAGSYHILKDKREDKYENSSVVYRYDGVEIWKQEKMNQFQMDEDDIKKFRTSTERGFKELRTLFKPTDKRAWENIEPSNILLLHDSVIGRMAVAICLDFLVYEKGKLLIEPHVNLIFVPSMSPTLKRFGSSNIDLGTFRQAAVFCANSCWIITGGEKCKFRPNDASYIYVPQKGGLMHLKHCPQCDCLSCNLKIYRISQGSKKYLTNRINL